MLKHEGVRWFEPHGGQSELLAEITRDGRFIVVTGAGNSWGKTEFLVAVLAAFCWPSIASAAFSHPLFRGNDFPKRARFYSNPKELEPIGSIQTAIDKYFPIGRFDSDKAGKMYRSHIATDTGWEIDFFSYEQDPKEVAGPNIGVQIFNEPPPKGIWDEAIYRARPGLILGGMTQLYENLWTVDGIFGKADGKNIRVRYGNAEENCIEHGTRGNIPHAVLARMWEQSDPDELLSRKEGRPLSLSGSIFKNFLRTIHVAKEPIVPPAAGVSHLMVMDPALGKPCFCLWAYVDHSGSVSVYDEWPEGDFFTAKDPSMSVSDYVTMIRSREGGRKIDTRILDRHFAAARPLGGDTLKEQFGALGIDFTDSYHVAEAVPEVETGILRVKDYLRYDAAKPIDAINRPRLVISPTCTNTIKSLERWSRNPETGRPTDEYKDPADCIRYLLMSDPAVDVPGNWGRVRIPQYGVGNV